MISKKAKTVKDLEEIKRLEATRKARAAVDPKNKGDDRYIKRLRSELLANTATGPTNIGSPRASSAAPPKTSEPVDFARIPTF